MRSLPPRPLEPRSRCSTTTPPPSCIAHWDDSRRDVASHHGAGSDRCRRRGRRSGPRVRRKTPRHQPVASYLRALVPEQAGRLRRGDEQGQYDVVWGNRHSPQLLTVASCKGRNVQARLRRMLGLRQAIAEREDAHRKGRRRRLRETTLRPRRFTPSRFPRIRSSTATDAPRTWHFSTP